jgi:hypothetical protein
VRSHVREKLRVVAEPEQVSAGHPVVDEGACVNLRDELLPANLLRIVQRTPAIFL